MTRERIQKVLAAAGVCSRRKAEALLVEGRVSVNGQVAQLGEQADAQADRIFLDGKPLALQSLQYWILNKPKDVLSTTRDARGRKTVLDLLPEPGLSRLVPVGRLDKDTEGLLLLTNDGGVHHALLHPSMGNEREYRVCVLGCIAPDGIEALKNGMELDDGQTAPARVTGVRRSREHRRTVFQLTMIEGRKRQIRRMLRKLGHPVAELVRVRIGPLQLGDLPLGHARALHKDEIEELRRHVARLQKNASGGKGKNTRTQKEMKL